MTDILSHGSAKMQVKFFLQAHLKRPILKEDMDYETMPVTGGFQCRVTLHCLGGDQYAGECCQDAKAAELSAAQQVVEGNREMIEELTQAGVTLEALEKEAAEFAVQQGEPPKKKQKGSASVSGGLPKNPAALSNKNTLQGLSHSLFRVGDMAKGTIQYDTVRVDGGFQSTCKISRLQGAYEQGFVSEISPDQKTAEQSAAGMMLTHMQNDEDIQQRLASKKGEDSAFTIIPVSDASAPTEKPSSNKHILNDLCMKITRGRLKKGDVAYDTQSVTDGSYQCTISIPSLGPDYETIGFTGEVCDDKKDAEQSAAGYAIDVIQNDANFQAALSAPAVHTAGKGGVKSGKGKGKGKSKGKEEGKGKEGMVWVSNDMMQDFMSMMSWMKGKDGKGKGKGKDKGKGKWENGGMAAMQGPPKVVPPPNQMNPAGNESNQFAWDMSGMGGMEGIDGMAGMAGMA